MTKWLTDNGELERLNAFCKLKVIDRIELEGMDDDIVLRFLDGSSARISTLGGLEIEELKA